MTILSVAVGHDRVLMIQDTGRFRSEPPHAQRGVTSKIVTLAPLRMIAGGAGQVAALLEWQRYLAAGVAGETLGEISEYAPPLLRQIHRDHGSLLVVLAALDDDGRAGAVLMQAARQFHPERIRRGTLLLIPGTAEEVEPADAAEAPAADDTQPEPGAQDEAPVEPEWVDWVALRLRLLRGVREQVSQRRVPFAEPFTSALLHREGIDFRAIVP